MAESAFTWTGDVRPVCQVGMSTAQQPEPDSWLDVSCYVHQAELFVGRDRFNDRFQPATASVTFSNENGWADLYGNSPTAVAARTLRPGRPIRIGVEGPWAGGPKAVRWLWRGWVDQTVPAYDPELHDTVTANCVDSLGEAGSATAAGGPFQGANETVTARINRVLDALGWFPTKRNIGATTTIVQGTSLGGGGIDLIGQAADSDGGVVYGDVAGNVVFRDRDWMLYNPATPPDGVIGNVDPGSALPPWEPGYIDPGVGFVYAPDPPAFEHPTIVKVCANGNDGTLVQQGDSFKLYADNGQLLFMSSGHLFDLGAFDGGCVGVIVDPNPPDGTLPVQRIDQVGGDGIDPDTGAWDIAPLEPVEVPVPFGVELLAWSDAGIDQEPTDSVTLGPITPGADCILVVLINAICDDVVAGLNPGIDGGGLDWQRVANLSAGDNGAEAHAFTALTARTDPGPLSITVDWAGGNHSRYHLVTVWKATAVRSDLFERMRVDLAAYLSAWTNDYPDNAIPPPGKGAFEVALQHGLIPPGIPQFTKARDITVAQTLAESPTQPWGAVFDDTDGAWVIPPSVPVPVIPLVSAVFTDDFERADGPLGDQWVQPTSLPSGSTVGGGDLTVIDVAHDFAIISGAAVGYADPASGPNEAAITRWVGDVPGGQYIEFDFEIPGDLSGGVKLLYGYLLLDETDFTSYGFEVIQNLLGFRLTLFHWTAGVADDSGEGAFFEWAATRRVTLRVEADLDGKMRAYLDDILFNEYNFAVDGPFPPPGTLVGMSSRWQNPTSSNLIRVHALTIGTPTPIAKASWIAGYRPGAVADTVAWTEVNTGAEDIQSTQAAVVIEPNAADVFGWGVLTWRVDAPNTGGLPAGGSRSDVIIPDRNAIVLVYVAAFAATDISASLNVTSGDLTFTLARTQVWDTVGHGQGAVFWAKTPPEAFPVDSPPIITVTWGAGAIEKLEYVAYQVTNADGVAASAGAVRGTHGDGSVDDGVTLVLSAAPAATSVVLGFLGVAATVTTQVDGATGGTGFTDELEVLGEGYGYLHVQSRTASTDTMVIWSDMAADATSHATDAVALAVEVTPGPDFAMWQDNTILEIGGSQDAFNGPIYTAARYTGSDPNAGVPVWVFDPAVPL